MHKKIAIRCDGDEKIGMGHIRRCLSLAKHLKKRGNIDVYFILTRLGEAAGLIENSGYSVQVTGDQDEGFQNLKNFIRQKKINCLVVDERVSLSQSNLMELKRCNIVIAIIDDLSDKRLAANLIFYPPIKQLEILNWDTFSGQVFSGWEWVILGGEFEQNKDYSKEAESNFLAIPKIMVSLGSSDVCNLTLEVINALDTVDKIFEIDVVIGKLFKNLDLVKASLSESRFIHKINIHENPDSMKYLIDRSIFCIANFGVTAYEIISCGKFSLVLCATEDHYDSADIFEKNGFSKRLLTKVGENDIPEIQKYIIEGSAEILDNEAELNTLNMKEKSISCGNGAKNVADIILSNLSNSL